MRTTNRRELGSDPVGRSFSVGTSEARAERDRVRILAQHNILRFAYTQTMNASFTPPVAPLLRQAIVDYAFIAGEGLRPKIIRPRTAAVLTVRLAGGVRVDSRPVPSATVGGVHERPFTLVPSKGEVDFVRVQFTPGGLRCFSRVAANTLRDRSVSADCIFPRTMVSGLVAQLGASPTVEERIGALDQFSVSLYSPLSRRDKLVLDLAERISRETDSTVAGILDSAWLGRRQIERLFAVVIGFSPRKFAQVY